MITQQLLKRAKKRGKKKNKPKQYKNKKHVDFIHQQRCCLRDNLKDCLGVLQAHHLLKPWDGVRGMGMKASDKNVIPLCMRHHIMLHNFGNEFNFFGQMTGDPDYGRKVAEKYWNESPFKENDSD